MAVATADMFTTLYDSVTAAMLGCDDSDGWTSSILPRRFACSSSESTSPWDLLSDPVWKQRPRIATLVLMGERDPHRTQLLGLLAHRDDPLVLVQQDPNASPNLVFGARATHGVTIAFRNPWRAQLDLQFDRAANGKRECSLAEVEECGYKLSEIFALERDVTKEVVARTLIALLDDGPTRLTSAKPIATIESRWHDGQLLTAQVTGEAG